ncbi:hypothetical protein [Candidatus Albibeggiatoa sp. nov. BB20]|uniref:hypothetical protein n=1 Tax=Candidatus Albibeggiatoa sp. nov. BB20 TaxID=3162723 RepID=UPI003365B004
MKRIGIFSWLFLVLSLILLFSGSGVFLGIALLFVVLMAIAVKSKLRNNLKRFPEKCKKS